MKWERNTDGTYSASGDGPMRAIVVEGETTAIARQGWMNEFANQYAEQEAASRPSLAYDYDDIRTSNYTGKPL